MNVTATITNAAYTYVKVCTKQQLEFNHDDIMSSLKHEALSH